MRLRSLREKASDAAHYGLDVKRGIATEPGGLPCSRDCQRHLALQHLGLRTGLNSARFAPPSPPTGWLPARLHSSVPPPMQSAMASPSRKRPGGALDHACRSVRRAGPTALSGAHQARCTDLIQNGRDRNARAT